jgi:hypothetical protein
LVGVVPLDRYLLFGPVVVPKVRLVVLAGNPCANKQINSIRHAKGIIPSLVFLSMARNARSISLAVLRMDDGDAWVGEDYRPKFRTALSHALPPTRSTSGPLVMMAMPPWSAAVAEVPQTFPSHVSSATKWASTRRACDNSANSPAFCPRQCGPHCVNGTSRW